ncbi:HobA family DNA replication regulator [Helicobacter marmotae]|uniref:DnaA initiator-associating factor for replication initiation HobA n=1 Tax=Helicobacter marmotae TaxID=152490 RepID=A0A3D8I2C6_9HELI|nr:HobA family DNA replication regulator [Helicobacter marmotae]RDU59282.1 hypothetical protein CQA63_07495 [Helicobacter marmotae]
MQNIRDWLINTIREDEKKGVMSGWIEENQYLLLPDMSRIIKDMLKGGALIVLTDNARSWFGEYIIAHINQPHKGRPFFPIVQITHLHEMIDANAQGDMRGFNLISDMLDMMYSHYKFWYIGKNNARSSFAKEHDGGWYWLLDESENNMLNATDEHLDYKLIILFKLFNRAILAAMLNKISLDI